MKTRTTPYHPQSDGIERFKHTLLSMLGTVASENPFNWESHLRPLSLAYNTIVHPTTGYTPFFLMFGRQVQMPFDLMYGNSPSYVTTSTSEYASILMKRLQEAFSRVRTRMSHKFDRQKQIYDDQSSWSFKKNDLVWLHSIDVSRGAEGKYIIPGLDLSKC